MPLSGRSRPCDPRVVGASGGSGRRPDHVRRADRGEHVEGVLRAGQLGVRDRLLRDLAQPRDERARLVDGDQRCRACRGSRRSAARRGRPAAAARRARSPPGRRRAAEHHLRRRGTGRASRSPHGRRWPRRSRTRRRAGPPPASDVSASSKPGWYAGSPGVSAASAARWPPAEPPVIAMKAGSPPYASTVLADPGDRPLHVDDVGGERVARAEPVVDRHAHPAAGGHVQHQRDALVLLVADRSRRRRAPAAAPALREVGVALPVDVERPALAVLGVGDVPGDLDLGVEHPERPRAGSAAREVEVGVGGRSRSPSPRPAPRPGLRRRTPGRPAGPGGGECEGGAGGQREAPAAAPAPGEVPGGVERGRREQVGRELAGHQPPRRGGPAW